MWTLALVVTDRLECEHVKIGKGEEVHRVLIKYCVFFQKFSKVCHLSLANTRLLLMVVQKITSQ